MFPGMSPVSRFPARVRSSFRRVRVPWPVLTAAEKTALLAVTLVLSTGGLLRAWERAGVRIGPVEDWDGLRALVIRSRDRLDAKSDRGREGGGYPCLDDAPVWRAGGPGGGGAIGSLAAAGADARVSGKKAAAGGKGGGRSGGKTGPARPLDLNAAGERALLALPGVGPSTAKAIVAWRTVNGRFHNVDDLLQVKGIGPKKLEALRPYLTVERKGEPQGTGPPPSGAKSSSGGHGPDGLHPDPGSAGGSGSNSPPAQTPAPPTPSAPPTPP